MWLLLTVASHEVLLCVTGVLIVLRALFHLVLNTTLGRILASFYSVAHGHAGEAGTQVSDTPGGALSHRPLIPSSY